jgi:hypothetical protein
MAMGTSSTGNEPKSEPMTVRETLRDLHRKMTKTARARFNASKRFARHQSYLLWTTSLYSTGLIIIPILTAFHVPLHQPEETSALVQVLLALFILVFSLLLTGNRYSFRSEEMLRCGLALNDLCHRIAPRLDDAKQTLYDRTLSRYTDILNAYDNHEDLDFAWVKLDYLDQYEIKHPKRYLFCLKVRYALHYWIYAVLVIVFLAAIAFLFSPWGWISGG